MRWPSILLAFLALAAACGSDEVVLPDTSTKVAARDELGRLVFTVTAEGYVRHAGRRVTLDEVAAIVERDESSEPPALRAAADAKWGPVQWTIATLQGGLGCDLLVVEPELPRSAVRLGWGDPWAFWGSLLSIEVPATPYPSYRVGRRATARPADVISWCREADALHDGFCAFAVEADFHTPFARCAAILYALHAAGIENVLIGLEKPHPWVRRQSPLPLGDGFPRVRYITDLNVKPVEPMTLPVARMAQLDKDDDPDDRIILNLDRDGRIFFRYDSITLAEFSDALADAARAYDEKMRERGQRGFEAVPGGTLWAKLYVLVRAQKDVPWRDVQWILAELRDAHLYKVQLAVSQRADLAYTPGEAAALGAEREPVLPEAGRFLDAKLQCFLPVNPPRGEEVYCDVSVTVDDGRVTYGHGGRTTAHASDVGPWISAWFKSTRQRRGKLVGRIHAPPEVAYKYVVAALNQFYEAGLEKVDLAGIARAPGKIRNAARLPR